MPDVRRGGDLLRLDVEKLTVPPTLLLQLRRFEGVLGVQHVIVPDGYAVGTEMQARHIEVFFHDGIVTANADVDHSLGIELEPAAQTNVNSGNGSAQSDGMFLLWETLTAQGTVHDLPPLRAHVLTAHGLTAHGLTERMLDVYAAGEEAIEAPVFRQSGRVGEVFLQREHLCQRLSANEEGEKKRDHNGRGSCTCGVVGQRNREEERTLVFNLPAAAA